MKSFFIFLCIVCFSLPSFAFAETPQQHGAKADGQTLDVKAIQNAINASEEVYFPKGYYLVNDTKCIIIPSGRKLIFDKDAVIVYTSTKHMQFESVFHVQGDNVKIQGLNFASDDWYNRSVYGNGARDGVSSLVTVVMIHGNNVKVLNSSINNADIGISIAKGNNIVIDGLKAQCSQTIYANHCSNVMIQNVESTLLTDKVSRLDHHIYFKSDCEDIIVRKCILIGGSSFALQFSGDYSNPSICPKNVKISDVTIREAKCGVVIDAAHTNLILNDIKAFGLASCISDSFFLSNRGGTIIVNKSVISGYNYIESETLIVANDEGNVVNFNRCQFDFTDSNACAFVMYANHSLTVTKCRFNYAAGSMFDGFLLTSNNNGKGSVFLKRNTISINNTKSDGINLRSPSLLLVHKRTKFI